MKDANELIRLNWPIFHPLFMGESNEELFKLHGNLLIPQPHFIYQ